jgi:hypothetical protein
MNGSFVRVRDLFGVQVRVVDLGMSSVQFAGGLASGRGVVVLPQRSAYPIGSQASQQAHAAPNDHASHRAHCWHRVSVDQLLQHRRPAPSEPARGHWFSRPIATNRESPARSEGAWQLPTGVSVVVPRVHECTTGYRPGVAASLQPGSARWASVGVVGGPNA